MTKGKQFSTISITASAFAVWLYIVTQIQPDRNDVQIIATFFLSLAVWVGCVISFFLYRAKVKQGNKEIVYAHVRPSIRQGFLISGTLTMLLFLQFLRVLTVWDTLLVALVPFLFEVALRQNDATGRRRA